MPLRLREEVQEVPWSDRLTVYVERCAERRGGLTVSSALLRCHAVCVPVSSGIQPHLLTRTPRFDGTRGILMTVLGAQMAMMSHRVSPVHPFPTNARCFTAGALSCLSQLASLHGGR